MNIETRATFILTYDGRRIVVPNSTRFVNPVIVNTANEKRRLEYDMTLPKPVDVARTKALVLRTMQGLPHVLRDPAPDLLLVGFTDKDATLRLRWWIQPPLHYELSRGLDTVLGRVREALLASQARAAEPPQLAAKASA
jgi:small-conductance mechanosensitive channel